jgi:hypothetical protein
MIASSSTVTTAWLRQEVGFDIAWCIDCSGSRPLALGVAEIVFLLAMYVLALYWNDKRRAIQPTIAKAFWVYAMVTTLLFAIQVPDLVMVPESPDANTLIRNLFLLALVVELMTLLRIARRHRRAVAAGSRAEF